MPDAIVNPEELIKFATRLSTFNSVLGEQLSGLKGHFAELSDSWRDAQFRRFEEEFNDTLKSLERFLQSSDEQVPRLLRKASAADDYLQQG